MYPIVDTHTGKTNAIKNIQGNAGFTLAELLVALVLGLFMVTAVIQSYLMTKQTYRTTNQISRIQENSRFATHFMSIALRESGNRGCIDEIRNMTTDLSIFDLSSPVIGWDFTGTNSGNSYTLPTDLDPASSFSASNWTQGAGINLPSVFDDKLVPGSDLFIVNKLVNHPEIVFRNTNSKSSGALFTEAAHGIENGQILLISDCSANSADQFQFMTSPSGNSFVVMGSGSTGSYTPANKNFPTDVWGNEWRAQATLSSMETEAFFVGFNAEGIPSLYQYDLGNGFTVGAPVEIVEGVENMQVVYGEDTDTDDLANRYVSANQVTDWSNIVSVRISLLVRSLEAAADAASQTVDTFILGENITIDPAADTLLRYVVTNTVKLRNKGLSNKISICEAQSDPTTETCNL